MTRWERRFEDHALWSKLEALRERVNDLDTPDEEGTRDTLNYMSSAVELALARHEDTPPMHVTTAMLDGAGNAVDQMTAHIDYWKSGQYNDDQMDAATDGLVQALATWPPLTPDQTARAHRAAARQITSTTEEVLEGVGQQRDSLTQSMSQLEAKVSALEQNIANQQTHLDSTLATFQTESQEVKDAAVEEWKEERTDQTKQAEETLTTLQGLEKEARELVHAATGSVVATDYGEYAKQKNRAAWACDIAAAIIGAAGVGAILLHLYSAETGADGDVGLSLTRLAASLGTLGIAALVAHRGHDHHKEARAAKRTDLALRRVGPFTANLESDIRERIIVETTDRIFVRGELDEGGVTSEGGSLWERIQKFRKEQESETG